MWSSNAHCHPGKPAGLVREPDARGWPDESMLLGPALLGRCPDMRDDSWRSGWRQSAPPWSLRDLSLPMKEREG